MANIYKRNMRIKNFQQLSLYTVGHGTTRTTDGAIIRKEEQTLHIGLEVPADDNGSLRIEFTIDEAKWIIRTWVARIAELEKEVTA